MPPRVPGLLVEVLFLIERRPDSFRGPPEGSQAWSRPAFVDGFLFAASGGLRASFFSGSRSLHLGGEAWGGLLFAGLRRDRVSLFAFFFSRARARAAQDRRRAGGKGGGGGSVNSELPSWRLTQDKGGDRSLDRMPCGAVARQVDNLRSYRLRCLSRLVHEN